MMCLKHFNSFRSEPSLSEFSLGQCRSRLDQNRQPLESCEPDPFSGFLVQMVPNMVQAERGY